MHTPTQRHQPLRPRSLARRPFLRLCLSLAAATAACAAGLGCSKDNPADAPPPGTGNGGGGGSGGALKVVVSLPPLKGIVEPLLPAGSEVDVLIPPGVNEHGYEIPPSRLRALTNADLVVYVGLGLEPQVEKMLAEHPQDGQAVICFANVVGEAGDPHDHAHHDHDHGHDHDHAHHDHSHDHDHAHDHAHGHDDHDHHHHGVDPHLWLDPLLVKQLVTAVAEKAHTTAAKRDEVLAKIDATDAAYVDLAKRLTDAGLDKRIVVTHNAYARLADRYGFTVVSLSGLTGGEPSPAAIQKATETIKAQQTGGRASAVFAEPQMADGPIRRVAEATGARVLIIDPLGSGDWFKLMDDNLKALKDGLLGGE